MVVGWMNGLFDPCLFFFMTLMTFSRSLALFADCVLYV